jgi:20S proteasome subunit alpha 6
VDGLLRAWRRSRGEPEDGPDESAAAGGQGEADVAAAEGAAPAVGAAGAAGSGTVDASGDGAASGDAPAQASGQGSTPDQDVNME